MSGYGSVTDKAVEVVNNATDTMASAIDKMSDNDVSAGKILEATIDINDATNAAAAATSAVQKEDQVEQKAIQTIG